MDNFLDTDYAEVLRIAKLLEQSEKKEEVITNRPSINDFLSFPLDNDEQEPCINCKFSDDCETTELDCVAFRNWIKSGSFQRKQDIGRDRKKVVFSQETISGV